MYSSEEKKTYMEAAFAEAEKARRQDEVPIGAVVVGPDGQIIGRGYNRRELDEDGTAHAEILAIKEACQKLDSWRLIDCNLFVTLEPCAMCAGAIINSRIKVFCGHGPKAGAASLAWSRPLQRGKIQPTSQIIQGLPQGAKGPAFERFLREIRRKQKLAKAQGKLPKD